MTPAYNEATYTSDGIKNSRNSYQRSDEIQHNNVETIVLNRFQ